MRASRQSAAVQWFARVALAAGFVSAVADRLGLWGPAGAPGVAWGNWEAFVGSVARLNWFVPSTLIPALAWAATLAELACAFGLLVGWHLSRVALASGVLLSSFALTMIFAEGIKAPLDYSVFAAAGAAFLLSIQAAHSPREGSSPHPSDEAELP